MFVDEPMIGLASTVIPPGMYKKIQSEEDLDTVMGGVPEALVNVEGELATWPISHQKYQKMRFFSYFRYNFLKLHIS